MTAPLETPLPDWLEPGSTLYWFTGESVHVTTVKRNSRMYVYLANGAKYLLTSIKDDWITGDPPVYAPHSPRLHRLQRMALRTRVLRHLDGVQHEETVKIGLIVRDLQSWLDLHNPNRGD